MTNIRQIDLNCDLGEGYPNDAELMKYVSSANVACGGHFGDADSMKRTVQLAIANNVAIGAHPSYPDPENFGRKSMNIDATALSASIIEQIDRLRTIARTCGSDVRHVKPHGALYNDSAENRELAALIARTIADYDDSLIFIGLANSISIEEAANVGLATCGEAFADRTYQANGKLTPRSEPNALVFDSGEALAFLLHLIGYNKLITATGESISVEADTICIHGDGPKAVEFASTIHRGLTENGIEIKPKYA